MTHSSLTPDSSPHIPTNKRYAIIGAGMAGILAAIKLLESGVRQITIYEKADRIGGTWRDNTYPGLTCDVPSHSYTYSFAPNPEWSRHFPPGDEILAYFEGIVDRFNLQPYIKLNEEVVSCQFNDQTLQWHLATSKGNADVVDIVIAATGVLHHPRYPTIKGMDSFKGAIFHSARWDHSVPLDQRKIAVIGTGSTGAQIVSALSTRAEKLMHFQRTPQWIMPVVNGHFTEEQKAAFRNDHNLLKYMQCTPEYEAMVERFTNAIINPNSPEMQEIEAIVRNNLEQSISDPVLREKLRPTYRAACKRLIFSEDFYQAIQRPNVSVVTEGVEEIEPTGIRTRDGVLHTFDVIVLATGFHADRFMRPMNVVGQRGVALNDVWKDRPTAYMAISIPQFPNLFMLNGPNGPVGNFSLIEIAEQQWHYIEQLLQKIANGRCKALCATNEALAQFDAARIAAAKETIFGSGCSSWYLDSEGVPATWPWSRAKFMESMQKPVDDDFCLLS